MTDRKIETKNGVAASAGWVEQGIPLLFVLIWATGFIIARMVAPHVAPLTFLSVRYMLSAAMFVLICLATGAAWPRTRAAWGNAALVGVLMQGAYLAGVFWSVRHGLPAGLAALIGGFQPLLTALLARPLLGEAVGRRRWLGVGLGFVGAALVLLTGLGRPDGIPPWPLLVCCGGVIGLTFGTIVQKRLPAGADLRANAAIQFIAAGIVTLPMAVLLEHPDFHFGVTDWVPQVWLGMLWAVLGLSVGAISLLLLMIRRGAVSAVASMFYLVPPTAALIAYAVFGERLVGLQIAGMLLAAGGVALASRPNRTA